MRLMRNNSVSTFVSVDILQETSGNLQPSLSRQTTFILSETMMFFQCYDKRNTENPSKGNIKLNKVIGGFV